MSVLFKISRFSESCAEEENETFGRCRIALFGMSDYVILTKSFSVESLT
jgi:hypothetical protein